MPGYTSVAVFLLSAIALVVPSGFSLGAAAHPYALAGVMLPVCHIGFGLTKLFPTRDNGVMTLAFMQVILWSLLHSPAASAASLDTMSARPA